MKYLKLYEELINIKDLNFQDKRNLKGRMMEIQDKLKPAIENDDPKLVADIYKKYNLDINEFIFDDFNFVDFKNNLLHHLLENETFNIKMKIVKYLIENDIDINAYNKYGATALINYIRYGRHNIDIKLVEYLLENGADPNLTEKQGHQSPLTYCGFFGGTMALDIIKLLIKYGADPYLGTSYNNYDYTPFRAYFNGEGADINKLIYLIMEHGVDPFEIHSRLLFNGVQYSDGNFFDYFLSGISDYLEDENFHLKELYPQLLEYSFQKMLIDRYGLKGIRQVINMGVNPKIEEEYNEIGMYINSKKYNL